MSHIIDKPFLMLEPLVGAPQDQLKVIFTLLVSYPLAHIFKRIPASMANTKHIFSVALSTFYIVGLFRFYSGYCQLVGVCVLTWVIAKLKIGTNSKGEGKGTMPWIVFWIGMIQLAIIHVNREILNPTTDFEISACQMVLVMKLITFAWNIEDGRTPIALLDSEQAAARLTTTPSLLAFLGHCLFFPQTLTGHSAEFATYQALVDGTLYSHPPATTPSSALANKEATDAEREHKSVKMPEGRKKAAYMRMGTGLVFLAVFALYGPKGAYEKILDRRWWKSLSLLQKFGFVQLAGFMARTKYYAIWSLSEGACIVTGIGFNGYDPKTHKPLWNRVRNLEMYAIESAQSYKVLFDSWNCRTNVWLRDTVYKRVTPRGKKPGVWSTLTTFVTSAFWHGISPGYYLAFVSAAFCTNLGRPFRHLVRPFFMPQPGHAASLPKRLYDFAGWFCVQTSLNYFASAFILLGWRECIQAWHAMGWYGHIMVAVPIVFFRAGGRAWLVSMNKEAGNKLDKKAVVPGKIGA